MSGIQAIETRYNGYRFRSRLEARWAVFFDAVGWDWLYEPEGYVLPGQCYLPDFLVLMPRSPVWVEIKPSLDLLGENAGIKVLNNLSDLTFATLPGDSGVGCSSFLLCGAPGDKVVPGMFFTRPVNRTSKMAEGHVLMSAHMTFAECPLCHQACLLLLPGADGGAQLFCFCDQGRKITVKAHVVERAVRAPRIMECYNAARSARFEHGETPKVPRGRPKKGG